MADLATRASLPRLVSIDLVDGREIDSAGDGFFLAFGAPSAAVVFVLRLRRLNQRKRELPAAREALHLGEPDRRTIRAR